MSLIISNKDIFINTELQLLKTTSKVIEKDNNFYYKSEKFPGFHGGNGIVVFNDNFNGNIEEYKKVYGNIFKLDNTIKINFYSLNKNIENLTKTNTSVDFQNIMLLKTHNRKVTSNVLEITNFNTLLVFEKKANEMKWFHNEGFEKKKLITQKNNIVWLGVFNETDLVSCSGYFEYNNFVRLQDVETLELHYRKGYSSSIFSKIINKQQKNKNICLYVDSDNETAIKFYEAMGFEKMKSIITVITIN